jgi:phage shock protein A
MDWARIARLLDTPVDKLVARLKRHESRLEAWQKRMDEQTKELERLTGQLRESLERRKKLVERVRAYDESAEAALRDGDEARARDILLQKQDSVKQLAFAKTESETWYSAVKIEKDKLERTRDEANAILTAEGLPPIATRSEPAIDPDAPKVRIKT